MNRPALRRRATTAGRTRGNATRRRSTRKTASTGERRGDVVFSVVAVVVVFGSLLGTVVVQTFIVQNRVKLDAVTAQLNVERERNQELRLQVIELEAPKRIIDTASENLGMVRPEQRTYLPGIDPMLETIAPPPPGDPFGPAPLPASYFANDEPEAAEAVAKSTVDEGGQ